MKTLYRELGEAELAELCSQGDRGAQSELYTRYAAKILTLCRRYSDNPDDAYDLMQDSLIKAIRMIGSFSYRGPGSLYAWICRLTVNEALSRIRKRKMLLLPLEMLTSDKSDEITEAELQFLSQEELLDIISSLPTRQRAVFNMFCIDGYSHKDIAQMLGISEKGSAGLLAKARTRLKKEVGDFIRNSDK